MVVGSFCKMEILLLEGIKVVWQKGEHYFKGHHLPFSVCSMYSLASSGYPPFESQHVPQSSILNQIVLACCCGLFHPFYQFSNPAFYEM